MWRSWIWKFQRRTAMPDTLEWINNYYDINLDEENLSPIYHFSLLWNMFESIACDNEASIQKIERTVEAAHHRMSLHQNDYEKPLNYFRSRYVTDGQTNDIFDGFSFNRNHAWKPRVANALINHDAETLELITVLLVIAYRYRNNLFHGVKDIPNIEGQKANFKNANKVLKQFLNDLKARI